MPEHAAPDLHTEEKPKNWGRRTNAPYFRERYALELKAILDGMMLEYQHDTHSPKIFRYIDYPELSHNSLYLKINQSKLYLIEFLDSEKIYSRFLQLLLIKRYRNKGIVLEYADDAKKKSTTPLHASGFAPAELKVKQHLTSTQAKEDSLSSIDAPVNPKVETSESQQTPIEKQNKEEKLPEWRITLHAFIEQGEVGQSITLKNIVLGNSDIEYAKKSLEVVAKQKCLIYKISGDKIFVARLTQEQFNQITE